ncbi:tetratricopeptide repeat protein [candidate division TA06 bacterium]|nr:tetratricopeptide repeat protein [candidate division TA06 bacterium]
MNQVKFYLSILFLLSYTGISLAFENRPYDYVQFGDFLCNEKDWEAAIIEYQKAILFTLDSNSALIHYKIGRCYDEMGNGQKAIDWYKRSIGYSSKDSNSDSVIYKIGFIYYKTCNYDSAKAFMGKIDKGNHNIKQQSALLDAKMYLKENQIFMASRYNIDYNLKIDTLIKLGDELPARNRAVSGIMSAIIPGTGRIYSGRLYDGVSSMIMCGTLGFQAYRYFEEEGSNSAKGWVMGLIGGVFYLGNIYGSIKAADEYNNRQRLKYNQAIDDYNGVYDDN